MTETPKHDIIVSFFDETHQETNFHIRVASRDGHTSAEDLRRRLEPFLREDVTMTVEVVRSRFAPAETRAQRAARLFDERWDKAVGAG